MRAALHLALLLVTPRILAQTTNDEAEALLRRGVELRRAGRDAESLDVFARAYALHRGPRMAAQWGLACQAAGRWAQAEALLRESLATTDDPWVLRNREALVRARDVASRHLATVELLGGPVGAQVRLNGEAAGALPLTEPLRALAGTTVIELASEGYEPLVLRFSTAPGEVLRERVQMVPRAPPERVVTPPPPERVVTPPPPERVVTPPPAPAAPTSVVPTPRPGRTWAAVAWVGAGVFGAIGVTALVLREDAIAAYNQSCDAGDARGECGALRDRGLLSAGAALVSLPVAALLTGAGALLWVSGRPSSRTTTLRCAPTIGGLQCGARF